MALVIPNIESITNGTNGFDFQAVEDSTDFQAIALADAADGYVTAGLTVTPSSGMTVAVASGKYIINGSGFQYAGGTIAVGAASATDRRDIITLDSSGTLHVTAGTPCGTAGWTRTSTNLPPVKPAIPANQVLLAEIAVTSTTTTIAAANIVDKTDVRAPYVAVGTPNTGSQSLTAGSANQITGTKTPIGTGELAVGTQFRFTLGLTKTAAGIATWTATVKFGTAGTTADGTIATFTSGTNTALADRAILIINVTITAVGSGTTATASCLSFYTNQATDATGLGSIPPAPGSTAGFNSTATNPFIHVCITPGTSAVMTGWGMAERLV